MGYEIIVVGTSWGGLSALRTLVGGLPADLGVPVVLVQHRHRQSDNLLSSLLQERTRLNVCEVEDKAPIVPGNVYVAPADYHLLVDRGLLSLTLDAPVRFSRPSIDVTFSSAADSYGARAVGIVLTGANADGASGLRRIVDRGGLALVQQPSEAESPAMPTAALNAVPQARVLGLKDMGPYLATLPIRSADEPARASARTAPEADGR